MVKASSQDLLLYWKPKTADDILKREDVLDYVASDQLRRASTGDVVWVVTVYDGELFLLSKLHIGAVTDRNGAIKQLGEKDVWGNKKHYAIAAPGKVESLKKISLGNVAHKLVFKSVNKESARLNIDAHGKVNAQQLQTMRTLEESSEDLLEQIWRLG